MKVAIVMGSASDMPVIEPAVQVLKDFEVEHEVKILSAHRTPDALAKWVSGLRERGFTSVIAAAGGAAHLAGVVAAYTTLPVIGVPVKSRSLEGLDSLLSMAQMPGGVPVATMAIDGGKNAALFAIEIIGATDERMAEKLSSFRKVQADNVFASNKF